MKKILLTFRSYLYVAACASSEWSVKQLSNHSSYTGMASPSYEQILGDFSTSSCQKMDDGKSHTGAVGLQFFSYAESEEPGRKVDPIICYLI